MKKYYIDLMKDPKYEHQSTFALWGRVKLNFRDMYRKPQIYSKNSSHYQFFSSNSQKMTLLCKKKKPLSTQMHLYSPPVTSQVHPPWWAPCWKFEKLQIMPLGFGYLESSEKSEKNTQILHI